MKKKFLLTAITLFVFSVFVINVNAANVTVLQVPYTNETKALTDASKIPTIPETTVPKSVARKNFLKIICFDTYACCTELMAQRISLKPNSRVTGVNNSYPSP